MTELKANRQYKDRVFRMIFNSREKLLELYNAMNGTDYENVEELEKSLHWKMQFIWQ